MSDRPDTRAHALAIAAAIEAEARVLITTMPLDDVRLLAEHPVVLDIQALARRELVGGGEVIAVRCADQEARDG